MRREFAIIPVVCAHGFYVNPNSPPFFVQLKILVDMGWRFRLELQVPQATKI
jgi:hypothetical protein